MAYTKRVSVLP